MFSQNVKKKKKKIPKNMLNSHDHWAYNGLTEKKKILKTKTSFIKIPRFVIQPLKKKIT